MIVGGSEGLRVSENIGGREHPGFAMRQLLLDINGQPLLTRPFTEGELRQMESGQSVSPAGNGKLNPLAVDWDQDGVLDLLVTDSYRKPDSRAVSFFRGVKTPGGHRFEPGIDLLPAENGAKALPGSGPRVYVDDWNRDGVNDLIIGASVATVNGGEFSDELSWEWESTNKVESAGKDPGRYPPRKRPTRESLSRFHDFDEMTEEEIEKSVQGNVRLWEEDVGRLHRENKSHWLTMRHQGRIYVMLGRLREAAPATAEVPSRTVEPAGRRLALATPTQPPVTLAFVAPEKVRAREATDLAVSFTMRPGWYIYAPTGRTRRTASSRPAWRSNYPTASSRPADEDCRHTISRALRHLRGCRPAVGSARRGRHTRPARDRRQGYLPDLQGRPLPAAKNRDPAHDADRGWRRLTPDPTWRLRSPSSSTRPVTSHESPPRGCHPASAASGGEFSTNNPGPTIVACSPRRYRDTDEQARAVDAASVATDPTALSTARRAMKTTLHRFDRKAWISRFGEALEDTATTARPRSNSPGRRTLSRWGGRGRSPRADRSPRGPRPHKPSTAPP